MSHPARPIPIPVRIPVRLPRVVPALLAMLPLVLATSCTTLDRDVERTESLAISHEDAAATRFGQGWAKGAPADSSLSAFRLLESSLEAFAARIAVVNGAERTLDLQYYIFDADETGLFLVERLVAAADRGVRVRLLIDDMYAHGVEKSLAVFDSHPNIELRIFNPWTQRGSFGRGLEFVTTPRLNHRMHNKLFIGDGTVAIFGGRNIADEYFDLHADFEFKDLDVVAIGPVATEGSRLFDAFWNGPDAIPVSGLKPQPETERALADGRARLATHREEMKSSPYADAIRSTELVKELSEQSGRWIFARAQVLGDTPDKTTRAGEPDWKGSLGEAVDDVFFGATRQVIASSPYFVPRDKGTDRLCELAAGGVEVVILTNSFAANDVGLVHAGYAKYRPRLVDCGVKLFELRRRQSTAEVGDDGRAFGSANASLHAKTFVVDRERVFIGSLNLDPRSIALNTEVGVLIESVELAEHVAASILTLTAPEWAYRISRDEAESLIWISEDAEGNEVIERHDPDTSAWKRFTNGLAGLLPIESQI